MLLGKLGTLFHMGAYGGRGSVQNRDLVSLDDFPPAFPVREIRRALVDHSSRRIGEWTVHDVGMSRDPANVGSGPVNVVVLEIKNPAMSHRGLQQIAGCRVEN